MSARASAYMAVSGAQWRRAQAHHLDDIFNHICGDADDEQSACNEQDQSKAQTKARVIRHCKRSRARACCTTKVNITGRTTSEHLAVPHSRHLLQIRTGKRPV